MFTVINKHGDIDTVYAVKRSEQRYPTRSVTHELEFLFWCAVGGWWWDSADRYRPTGV